jgi:hypothetical protein
MTTFKVGDLVESGTEQGSRARNPSRSYRRMEGAQRTQAATHEGLREGGDQYQSPGMSLWSSCRRSMRRGDAVSPFGIDPSPAVRTGGVRRAPVATPGRTTRRAANASSRDASGSVREADALTAIEADRFCEN